MAELFQKLSITGPCSNGFEQICKRLTTLCPPPLPHPITSTTISLNLPTLLQYHEARTALRSQDWWPTPESRPLSGRWNYRVAEPYFDDVSFDTVTAALASRNLSSASITVAQMHMSLKSYFSVPVAQACSNGFSSLVLSLQAGGLAPGQRVLVPSFTMVAVPNAVHYCGGVPVFVDNAPGKYNPGRREYEAAAAAVLRRGGGGNSNGEARVGKGPSNGTDRCSSGRGSGRGLIFGIVVCHTYGVAADVFDLRDMCEGVDRSLGCGADRWLLLEDISECFGNRCNGQLLGTVGDFGAASMYANKTVTAGDGGFVISKHPTVGPCLQSLVNHGFLPGYHFVHIERCIDAKINGLGAALALSAIDSIDRVVRHRSQLATWYRRGLRPCHPYLQCMPQASDDDSPWVFGVHCHSRSVKEALRRYLAQHCGVETRNFFPPLHRQPAYCNGGTVPGTGDCSRGTQVLDDVDRDRPVDRNLEEAQRDGATPGRGAAKDMSGGVDGEGGHGFVCSSALYEVGLYLPTHFFLTEEDVTDICSAVRYFFTSAHCPAEPLMSSTDTHCPAEPLMSSTGTHCPAEPNISSTGEGVLDRNNVSVDTVTDVNSTYSNGERQSNMQSSRGINQPPELRGLTRTPPVVTVLQQTGELVVRGAGTGVAYSREGLALEAVVALRLTGECFGVEREAPSACRALRRRLSRILSLAEREGSSSVGEDRWRWYVASSVLRKLRTYLRLVTVAMNTASVAAHGADGLRGCAWLEYGAGEEDDVDPAPGASACRQGTPLLPHPPPSVVTSQPCSIIAPVRLALYNLIHNNTLRHVVHVGCLLGGTAGYLLTALDGAPASSLHVVDTFRWSSAFNADVPGKYLLVHGRDTLPSVQTHTRAVAQSCRAPPTVHFSRVCYNRGSSDSGLDDLGAGHSIAATTQNSDVGHTSTYLSLLNEGSSTESGPTSGPDTDGPVSGPVDLLVIDSSRFSDVGLGPNPVDVKREYPTMSDVTTCRHCHGIVTDDTVQVRLPGGDGYSRAVSGSKLSQLWALTSAGLEAGRSLVAVTGVGLDADVSQWVVGMCEGGRLMPVGRSLGNTLLCRYLG